MSDRFKFRVWDKESQKYHNGMEVFDYMRGVVSPDKYVMEQCTGLKDKNGKLVYDGDIVKTKWFDKITIYKVVWDWATACFILDNKDEAYSFDEIPADMVEIIGNTHENKELLDD